MFKTGGASSYVTNTESTTNYDEGIDDIRG